MFAERHDTHRASSILERLNHHLADCQGLSQRQLDALAEAVCGLVSDVLHYRTVMLLVDDGNGLRCSLKRDRRGQFAPLDAGDGRLLQLVRGTVQEPTVLEPGSPAGRPGAGISALGVAPLAAPLLPDGKNTGLGHLVALRPYGAHDPDVDLPLLGILASLAGTAILRCGERERSSRVRSRLLTALRTTSEQAAAMRENGERWRVMAEYAATWEAWLSPDGAFLHSSRSSAHFTGYPAGDFIRDPKLLERIIHPSDRPVWRQAMAEGTMQDCPCAEFRIVHRDGFVRWVSQATSHVLADDGRDMGLRLSFHDITEQKYAELRLQAETMHDPHTGLPGRALCLDRVEQALERAHRSEGYILAVACVGLDCFNFFARCCGKGQEERLRADIAHRLQGCVRRLDTVSSLEDDTFAVFLDGLTAPREAVGICKRIRAALSRPFLIDGCELNLQASLGLDIGPRDHEGAEALYRNAQIAMRQAVKTGRHRFKVYTARLSRRHMEQRGHERELRRAVTRGEFFLEFQPIMSLRKLRPVGVEALVRWRHPQRGAMRPEEFLPLAEEIGLGADIGTWVMEEACRQTATWLDAMERNPDFAVSVNVSGRQITQPDMVDQVRTILERTGLAAERLRLDITEDALLFDAATALLVLSRLKAMGVRISLDDFRAADMPLSRLQVFPLDDLKLDLTRLGRRLSDPDAVAAVRAAIDQARGLGLDVVAEGVEEPAHEELLSSLGVEYGQGFLYARPMNAEQAGQRIPNLAGEPALTEQVSAEAHP
jgi:diguanylate cyclase (GGDEF)-like protein/PAS domain S-box-containing protein